MFRNKGLLICLIVGAAAIYRGYFRQIENHQKKEFLSSENQEAGQVSLIGDESDLPKTDSEQLSDPETQPLLRRDSGRLNSINSERNVVQTNYQDKNGPSEENTLEMEADHNLISELESSLGARLQATLDSESDAHSLHTELEVCLADQEIPPSIRLVCKKYSNLIVRKYPEFKNQRKNSGHREATDENQPNSLLDSNQSNSLLEE
jgi:hypothetical protein